MLASAGYVPALVVVMNLILTPAQAREPGGFLLPLCSAARMPLFTCLPPSAPIALRGHCAESSAQTAKRAPTAKAASSLSRKQAREKASLTRRSLDGGSRSRAQTVWPIPPVADSIKSVGEDHVGWCREAAEDGEVGQRRVGILPAQPGSVQPAFGSRGTPWASRSSTIKAWVSTRVEACPASGIAGWPRWLSRALR